MPKMKGHNGAAKRFKVTANGKLRRIRAGKKHLNSPKSSKRKRHLRHPVAATDKISLTYVKLLERV